MHRLLILPSAVAEGDCRIRGGDYRILPVSEYKRLERIAGHKDVDAVKFAAESIGRDIRRKRMAAGFSQGELARKAGLRPETISRLENGRGNPTIATIKKILRVLGGRAESA